MARHNYVIRPRDVERAGIPRKYVYHARDAGLIKSTSRRGFYISSRRDMVTSSLAEASMQVPHGVISLLSALEFHGLTTQAPRQVWMAISEKARRPKIEYPPIRFARFSKSSLEAGVERHRVGGTTIQVFSPAKTVADCFKYRNKIGLDVAIEALRDCRRQKKCDMDEIWKYAKIDRVAKIIKPYLEAIG